MDPHRKARITAEDLWARGEGDLRSELVNGRIVEMAPPGGIHGRVTGRISFLLAAHEREHGGGEVLVGDVGFVLRIPADPERVRGPDVAFVAAHRLPEGRLPEGFLAGAPDLVVKRHCLSCRWDRQAPSGPRNPRGRGRPPGSEDSPH
ncbi:MAG: Uma2 family endonuclease [Armatimonadota bacterium]